jgi:hypothetical protein
MSCAFIAETAHCSGNGMIPFALRLCAVVQLLCFWKVN